MPEYPLRGYSIRFSRTGLVRGRNSFGFLGFHLFAAAFQFTCPGFGTESFSAALGTLVSFP